MKTHSYLFQERFNEGSDKPSYPMTTQLTRNDTKKENDLRLDYLAWGEGLLVVRAGLFLTCCDAYALVPEWDLFVGKSPLAQVIARSGLWSLVRRCPRREVCPNFRGIGTIRLEPDRLRLCKE